eukprot:528238_1
MIDNMQVKNANIEVSMVLITLFLTFCGTVLYLPTMAVQEVNRLLSIFDPKSCESEIIIGKRTKSDVDTTSLDIASLKEIDMDTIYTVFGYVREQQNKYFGNIVCVELIYYIVLYYYQENDEWDVNSFSSHINLDPNDVNTIIHVGGPNRDGINGKPAYVGGENVDDEASCSTFLKKIVEPGQIFRWKFKIKKMRVVEEEESIIIGIVDVDNTLFKKYSEEEPWFLKISKFTLWGGYGFVLDCADITDPETGHSYEDAELRQKFIYGIKCKTDDILIMELNMKKLFLKYTINDIDYGIAYTVRKSRYKAAVLMSFKNDSIQIM